MKNLPMRFGDRAAGEISQSTIRRADPERDSVRLDEAVRTFTPEALLRPWEDASRELEALSKSFGETWLLRRAVALIAADPDLMRGHDLALDRRLEPLMMRRSQTWAAVEKWWREQLASAEVLLYGRSDPLEPWVRIPLSALPAARIDWRRGRIALQSLSRPRRLRVLGELRIITRILPPTAVVRHPPISRAALQRWYVDEHLPSARAQGREPSSQTDWLAARTKFGDRVTRQMLRELRRRLGIVSRRGRPSATGAVSAG